MALATGGINDIVSVSVPFNHMVVAYQSARKDSDVALEILKRSEHAQTVDEQAEQITKIFGYIDSWLKKWAPEELKFELQEAIPEVDLSEAQQAMLGELATKIESADGETDGQWFHEQVHAVREASGLEPKQAFQAIYRVLLNKDFGPKAGWFLSILEKDWLVQRFRRQV